MPARYAAPMTLTPAANNPPAAAGRARAWATSTVWAGLAWIALAMTPLPFTTFIGIPFSLYALLGGYVSVREGRAAGDPAAVRRGRWGMGLGCLGYVYLTTFFLIAGAVIVAGLLAAVRAAWDGTP